ncbi:protein of unknown function [Vibrio tapetis subsp. tapetis]|uniref:Uncharacterized protein n=1 Tax=Vibrio tapetis subsp. tapetis TaxID=1671868 RepID=A0A2N8ZKG9_9VIBR|nr:protein of unknown function [Vibrio tapetis subsp. tapetis]
MTVNLFFIVYRPMSLSREITINAIPNVRVLNKIDMEGKVLVKL